MNDHSSQTLLLRQVFTPGGQPSVTYVSRDHLGLEQRVKEALMRGFSINVVTGPTKSGKTVLCNHVLGQAGASVTIEGGQVRGESDFWEQVCHALEIGVQRVRKEVGSANDNLDGNLALAIPGVTASVKRGKGEIRTSERSVSYNLSSQRAALEGLQSQTISLLVDDFHYIDKDVQRSIIQALKGAVFKGLSVILLAVPHRALIQ